MNNVWKYSLSLRAVPAHFTKYITTVTVYQAMSSVHAQVTPSSSGLKFSLQFDDSSCAFPLPHWLSWTSIFNPEWWGGYTPTTLNGQDPSWLHQYHSTDRGCCSWNAPGCFLKKIVENCSWRAMLHMHMTLTLWDNVHVFYMHKHRTIYHVVLFINLNCFGVSCLVLAIQMSALF